MADLDVTVGVDTAAAEEGLRRLSTQFHREISAIDRSRAEAVVGADVTKFKKDIVAVKRELLKLEEAKASPDVELDEAEFKREVARLKLELKRLGQEKAEIQVNAAQLKAANREMALSAKRQEAMAKQTEKLDRAKERMERTTQRETIANRRSEVQVHKLREAYAKLAAEEDRLATKTGRPGGILRTPEENRRLALVRANLHAVREEVIELGGSVDDIDPEMERHGSILGRWARSLSEVRLHLGFFSANLKQLGVVLVLLGPALTGVLGAATSLVGVVGTSLAGALAVGAAGLAGFALAAGGVAGVLVPLVGELKAATDASEAYNDAVLKYGKGSDEAKTANEKLQQTLAGIDPEARRTIRSFGSLKERWKELTKEAREPVFDSAAEGMKTVQSLMPMFAHETTATTKVVATAWDEAMRALREDGARSGIKTIMENFRASLPPIFDGLGHIASALGRVSVSASKFLPGLGSGFEDWAAGIDKSVGSGAALDEKVGRLIHHMRELGHFMQATGRLGVALFDASADSGAGLLRTLTDLFNKWADWMRTVEGQRSLKRFFSEAADETRALFALLGRMTEFFFQMSRAVAPISDAFIGMLRVVGNIIDAASEIPVLNDALATTGKILAALWAVNRVRAFAAAVRGAAAAMGLMSAAQVAGGAAVGAGGAKGTITAAGRGAAAAGVAGGLLTSIKSVKWGKIGGLGLGLGLLNGVIEEVEANGAKASDNIITAFQAKLDDRSLGEKGFGINLPGDFWTPNQLQTTDEERALKNVVAQVEELTVKRGGISRETEHQLKLQAQEIDMTAAQRKQLNEIFALTRRGRELGIKVGAGMSPKQLAELLAGFTKLRSGAIASLTDIGKVMRENALLIRNTLPRGSEEARRKTADNFRAAATAIKKAMESGTIDVQRGTKRMRELLRNAKLVEGRDPLGLAKGFADSWREAGAINRRNRDRIIKELAKMPPEARREAFQMMLQYGRGLVRGKKIPESDLRLFKSRALTELDGIAGGFGTLSSSVYGALDNIGYNLRQALKDLGGKAPPRFQLQKYLNMLPELQPMGKQKGGGQQQGGFTVAGYGSGDHVPKVLPQGSFVMNREASSYFGLNTGGAVQTILEPKERVFMPHEVQQIGAQRLVAMNAAVPRAKGGGIGEMPQIIGRPSAALDIGRGSVSKAYAAAEAFFNKQKERFESVGGPLGSAPGQLGAVEKLAAQFGLTMTSGYRPGDSGSYHSVNRARDFSNGVSTPQEFAFGEAVARRWGTRLLELIHTPLGYSIDNGVKVPPFARADHYDHVHVAMMLGGLLKLLAGGPVGEWDQLSGPSWDNNEMATLAHIVGMSSPGLMGQIGQGESRGNRKAVGHDPGGTEGLGLWQVTTGYNDSRIAKWGGRDAMFHPYLNARAAEEIQEEQGMGAWYAPPTGTRGVVNSGLADQMRAIVSGGGASGAGSQKGLPKQVKVKHPVYKARGTKGGAIEAGLTKKTTETKVPIDIPDFGPIPEKEGEVRRELADLEHRMLPEYRAAVRQYKNKKGIVEHLRASLRKIETRIRELRAKLRELRLAKARKRVTKKLSRQLGRITGYEPVIEAAQRNYEEKEQFAEQVVGQEPEQTGELTSDWLTNIFEPYVRDQEGSAYASVLDSENNWRNTILTAQEVAKSVGRMWEVEIGYPEANRKPWLEDPSLHFPPRQGNDATGLAAWIYSLHDSIQRIRDFASSHPPSWWAEHPNARARRDKELREIDTYYAPKLAFSKFRRKGTIGVLGEGRESFDWYRGTGSFEDSMQEVQGLHWPEQHEKLPSLPSEPVPGQFGGAIYATQETIQDLGIKIKQAKESLEGTDTAGEKAAEIAAFEEAIHGLLAGRPFLSINHQNFMGAFARGGVALVGERGPELAHMPSGTRIHNAEDTARLLEPQVVVDLSRIAYGPLAPGRRSQDEERPAKVIHMTNYFDAPPPDPHTWAKQQQYELGTLA